ncbi:MtrAB system histidine kinase MtrB [Dermacoccaceae bacterium W4C1]
MDAHQPAAAHPPEPSGSTAAPRPAWSGAGSALGRTLHRAMRPWRRSLHLRVMTITMLLGVLVTFALGSFMYQRIADGLVTAKMSASESDAEARRADAVRILGDVTKTDQATLQTASEDVLTTLASADGQARQVVLRRAIDNDVPGLPSIGSTGSRPNDIPLSLAQALADDPERQQSKIVTADIDGRSIPAVVIGSRITVPNSGAYDLYLIYPMAQEVSTVGIVRQSFFLGGVALVLILGGLAYMVTRMVVTPVRAARHVAERLAAGALNERLRVHGEDDLARLATSFNEMAGSLQKQIRQLEDLSVVQQRFTSDVSHELRTPLTTIRMAADLLYSSREEFDPSARRASELLLKELDRFESLLTDLMEISRFDAGAANLELAEVDLRDVVNRVVDSTASLAVQQHTLIRVDAPKPSTAQMDQRRVERIVRNLVTNAIEHSEGRPVQISVGADDSAVAVAVRDHGIGLRPGDATMVFNRFWRADPARARTIGGTGLGLSISLEDARLHDGWLQAWGEPGEGSCFRLTLPRMKGEQIKRSPVRLVPDGDLTGPLVVPAEVRLR